METTEPLPAAVEQTQQELCLGLLPPELLVAVFAHVPLEERQCSLALVCRQWSELVHSPALLASLDVSVVAVHRHLQPALESLLEWMARRAVGHVRQLRLEVWVLPNRVYNHIFEQDEDDYEPPFEGDVDSLAAMMSAILMHGSSLRSLAVDIHPPGLLPPLGPWLAPLRGLTSLSLECSDIIVNGPLTCLAALQQLQLLSRPYEHLSHACALRMRPGVVALPPTLTSLCLNALRGGFPGEAAALQRLQELTMLRCSCRAGTYSGLAGAHSTLTALTLRSCRSVPACLGQLTALRSLAIEDDGRNGFVHGGGDSDSEEDDGEEAAQLQAASDWETLEQALPNLQHLTAVYCFSSGRLPSSPAALASLQHLETVAWVGLQREPAPLPAGPWLARLRCLVVSAHFLSDAASLATLSGAHRLERLALADCYRWALIVGKAKAIRRPNRYHKAELQRIVAWAPGHASLQQLVLETPALKVVEPAVQAAHRARPLLQISQATDVSEAVSGFSQDPQVVKLMYGHLHD